MYYPLTSFAGRSVLWIMSARRYKSAHFPFPAALSHKEGEFVGRLPDLHEQRMAGKAAKYQGVIWSTFSYWLQALLCALTVHNIVINAMPSLSSAD
jgi:hypothetical protein